MLGAAVGGLLAYFTAKTMPLNALPYALAGSALAGFVAGFVARRQGVVAGVFAVVVAALLWSADVLGGAWLAGDLARAFPECDPCGFNGFLARMLVVSATGIAALGPLAGICGWLGTVVRARMKRG